MDLNQILDFILYPDKNFPNGEGITVRMVLYAILIMVGARLLSWFTNKIILKRFYKRRQIDVGRQYTVTKLVFYLIYTAGILTALEAVGISISVLWAGSAAFLVAVGLGLQQPFNDFVSGMIILFTSTVEVGDVIQVEGLVAKVKQIGLRTSEVETRDAFIIIIPNSKLVTENVINWSHNETPTRFQVSVGVAYSSDIEEVKKLLLKAAHQHDSILQHPGPQVEFRDFGASSLDFILHYYSYEFFNNEMVKSDLRFIITKKFRDNGIEIPFPQRDLWIRTEPGKTEEITEEK